MFSFCACDAQFWTMVCVPDEFNVFLDYRQKFSAHLKNLILCYPKANHNMHKITWRNFEHYKSKSEEGTSLFLSWTAAGIIRPSLDIFFNFSIPDYENQNTASVINVWGLEFAHMRWYLTGWRCCLPLFPDLYRFWQSFQFLRNEFHHDWTMDRIHDCVFARSWFSP